MPTSMTAVFRWKTLWASIVANPIALWTLVGFVALTLFFFVWRLGRVLARLGRHVAEQKAIEAFAVEIRRGTEKGEPAATVIQQGLSRRGTTKQPFKQVSKYVRIVQGTGEYYDPELHLRQEFSQEEHASLLECDRILVRLGLLGTFAGLMIGLGGIDTASERSLANSIMMTLGSMSLAFLTSLIGLFLSLLLSIAISRYARAYERWEDTFSELLGQLISPAFRRDLASGVMEFIQAASKLSTASEAMKGAASALNTSTTGLLTRIDDLKKVVDHLQSSMAQTTHDSIGKVGTLAEHLDTILTSHETQLESQKASAATLTAGMVSSLEQVRLLAAQFPAMVKELGGLETPLQNIEGLLRQIASAEPRRGNAANLR